LSNSKKLSENYEKYRHIIHKQQAPRNC
jgi:hypothetical protein